MRAPEHLPECALPKFLVAKNIPLMHILRLHVLELLEVVHVQRLFLLQWILISLLREFITDIFHELSVPLILALGRRGWN